MYVFKKYFIVYYLYNHFLGQISLTEHFERFSLTHHYTEHGNICFLFCVYLRCCRFRQAQNGVLTWQVF